MTRSKLELVSPRPPGPAPKVETRPAGPPMVLGAVLVAVATVASFAMHHQFGALLAGADERALDGAVASFSSQVELQRQSVLSGATVLAEDTRVRATVMTPNFDEATVRDVLDDLKKTSGASMLAVLDVSGKVRAVTGAQLREVDLGNSPLVKAAAQRPGSDLWTYGEQVMVVGIAPVRAGQEVTALFLMGFEVGQAAVARIHQSLGVAGGVLVRERLVARSSEDPAVGEALRLAATIADDRSRQIEGSGGRYLARVTRTSDSAASGKLVWAVSSQIKDGRVGILRVMMWTPVVFTALAFALLSLAFRREAPTGA